MNSWCHNRLTIIGRARDLQPFDEKGRWPRKLSARHIEWLEFSPTRHVWQFETKQPPLESLKGLSIHWPKLTFLLEYDCQHRKGLTKARNGRITCHQVSY